MSRWDPVLVLVLAYRILSRMLYYGLSWLDVLLLTPKMPNLAILQVQGNVISKLGLLPAGALDRLEKLDFDDNLLDCWTQLDHPASLRLDGNRLTLSWTA